MSSRDAAPKTTSDGRFIVVDGRRWRTSDPMLAEDRRQALVDELMAARRAVAAARRDADPAAEKDARGRVHAAKLALGERGEPWWRRIEREIAAQVKRRGPGRTVCPSEVARALADDERFRDLMPHVREAAAQMAERGEVAVTQKGEPVDARTARGPIRLGLPITMRP